jgi:glycosyltransferase involved in cell wall biosynthesis
MVERSNRGQSGPQHTPKVSIGLAVYNGERYLDEAISSILSQTFEDFELVICDNDSSDSTPKICADFAAADGRIRYYRNPVNIGGVRNENRTMFLARGEYFKLAAHDDKIAPEFLEQCVAVLDSEPDCEVCLTASLFIGEDGEVLQTRMSSAGSEPRRHERIRAIADWSYACEAAYGLMRMSALREVRPQMNHVHSDRVVLSELALRSPFVVIDEPLFYKRIYEENVYADPRKRMSWYQPQLAVTGGIRLPHWQQAGDYAAMLGRSRMGLPDRVLCSVELLRCCWQMRRQLVLDVVDGALMVARGKQARRVRYDG